MCGIAGIIATRGRIDPIRLQPMLEVQQHRGPDGRGTWLEKNVALGHVRLAILDTSDAGAQPMRSADGNLVITYNGEIYNYVELRDELARLGYRFRTGSDTEVLLAAWAQWDEACLDRLNGMFAFALHDTRTGNTTLVRDRLGVKPLVWCRSADALGFASEAKALVVAGLADGAPEPDAVYEYLARGYTSEGRSFWRGINHLLPGSLLRIDADGGLHPRRWWRIPEDVEEGRSDDEWSADVADLLDDAVRIRMRSDVPVGAHLSGGLDSSAIATAAARHATAPIQSFTGAFVNDADSDERHWARMVAEAAGLAAREVEIDVDELGRWFSRIIWHMDEPIAGPGVFPQLIVCRLVAANDVTVVLGGQGGDELFAGYLRHRACYLRARLRHGGPLGRISAATELAGLARQEWRRVRRTSTRAGDAALDPSFLAMVDPELRREVRQSPLSSASARDLMRHDLTAYLPALLHVEDRTSMAVSIESRTPLLDYRLVERARAIPEAQLFRRGTFKPILRDAVRNWLPPAVADRTDKKGFPTPLQHWTERPALGRLVEDLAQPTGDERMRVFRPEYLAGLANMQASELWTMLTVQGWLRRTDWRDAHASGLRQVA